MAEEELTDQEKMDRMVAELSADIEDINKEGTEDEPEPEKTSDAEAETNGGEPKEPESEREEEDTEKASEALGADEKKDGYRETTIEEGQEQKKRIWKRLPRKRKRPLINQRLKRRVMRTKPKTSLLDRTCIKGNLTQMKSQKMKNQKKTSMRWMNTNTLIWKRTTTEARDEGMLLCGVSLQSWCSDPPLSGSYTIRMSTSWSTPFCPDGRKNLT